MRAQPSRHKAIQQSFLIAEATLQCPLYGAAERLGLSASLVEQLVIRYPESGAAGLMSRKRGHPRIADWMSNWPGGRRRLSRHLSRFRPACGRLAGSGNYWFAQHAPVCTLLLYMDTSGPFRASGFPVPPKTDRNLMREASPGSDVSRAPATWCSSLSVCTNAGLRIAAVPEHAQRQPCCRHGCSRPASPGVSEPKGQPAV